MTARVSGLRFAAVAVVRCRQLASYTRLTCSRMFSVQGREGATKFGVLFFFLDPPALFMVPMVGGSVLISRGQSAGRESELCLLERWGGVIGPVWVGMCY